MEKRGIPTVTVCTDQFLPLARKIAAGLDAPQLRLVMIPHPLGSLIELEVRERASGVIDSIANSILTPIGAGEDAVGMAMDAQPHAVEVSALDEENMDDALYRRGWTDGLPVVMPTEERVARLFEALGQPGNRLIGAVPPRDGLATVEKIAVNAAMAGCLPDHMPVVLAAVQAMLDPAFDLRGVQVTTGPHAPLLLVNGPVSKALEINGGANAFGPGWRSNARIGRALRLILLNIGGGIPGSEDKATLGHPSKYSYCAAENEDANPWEPFHVSRGFQREESVVTVFAAHGPANIHDTANNTARGLLTTVADTMATLGGSKLYRSHCESLIVLSPEHAAIIAKDGWSRKDVQQFIVDNARRPLREARRGGMFGTEQDWPAWVDLSNDDAMVPLNVRPEDVLILVAGGPGRHSAHMPLWSQSKAISRRVTCNG